MTKSHVTSYAGLFSSGAIERIEIPLIQRDYAQGRDGEGVQRIRASFLDVLQGAVTGGDPVSLDFVYGDVENGTLRPLDGQQRLTTLFLLHWYLAARVDRLSESEHWKRFSYATRASARLFCSRLVACRPPTDEEHLSTWLVDQSWFLYTWKLDPTIQSMLVMLDAIHERLRNEDCAAAWKRLIDVTRPAIAFHLLSVEEMRLGEDLYVKMNSRGKPLTPFENFKARFLQLLESWCPPSHVQDIALKLDGPWSDVFWAYRGDDDIVDDELMRFFHFASEICEWREGTVDEEDERVSVDVRAERVFGPGNANKEEHLAFLVAAFDTWVGVDDVGAVFDALFTKAPGGTDKVVLFGAEGGVEIDLFGACVRGAGEWNAKKRVFTLPAQLLFYSVLLARFERATDIARSLRVLRNLVEASSNEIRAENMPGLLADVRRIVVDGTLDDVSTFNTAQVVEERKKRDLIAKTPELEVTLFALEDQPILRGALAAFDLDVERSVLEKRAGAFERVFSDATCWPLLTGALLAVGDYSRRTRTSFQLGSGVNEAPWREVFTAPAARSSIDSTRAVLGAFLDEVAKDAGDLRACLERIQSDWLAEQSAYDWRYYFVKYPAMREGHSGIYFSATDQLGFDVCMLDKKRLSSNYRDPYLHAMWRLSGVGDGVEKEMFSGYATEPRWMSLTKSGVGMRCVELGIALRKPGAPHAKAFSRICEEHGVGEDHVLRIEQREAGVRKLDLRDRIEFGAELLREMVNGGL